MDQQITEPATKSPNIVSTPRGKLNHSSNFSRRRCPCCGRDRVGPIRVWERLTAYHDPRMNRMYSCVHCIREDDRHYASMWRDYYADQGHAHRIELPIRPGRRPTVLPARYRPTHEESSR